MVSTVMLVRPIDGQYSYASQTNR